MEYYDYEKIEPLSPATKKLIELINKRTTKLPKKVMLVSIPRNNSDWFYDRFKEIGK